MGVSRSGSQSESTESTKEDRKTCEGRQEDPVGTIMNHYSMRLNLGTRLLGAFIPHSSGVVQ